MPNDEKEQDRLDLHHEIIRLAWDNKLHEAPITNSPNRILDIATGTGDMGCRHGGSVSDGRSNWN